MEEEEDDFPSRMSDANVSKNFTYDVMSRFCFSFLLLFLEWNTLSNEFGFGQNSMVDSFAAGFSLDLKKE